MSEDPEEQTSQGGTCAEASSATLTVWPRRASRDRSVCNILVVDDEPASLLALEAILEPLGQRVVPARSGVEALRHALKTEFCVVVLDVQMPEMDGIETAELLRMRSKTRDVPIIYLATVGERERDVARACEAGAADHLLKPFDPHAMRAKVASFVEVARERAMPHPPRDERWRVSGPAGTAIGVDARVREGRALRVLADATRRLSCPLGVDVSDGVVARHELENVLRSALPILGDGVILDVESSELWPSDGVSASGTRAIGGRLRVARGAADAARLSDPRFDLGSGAVFSSGRADACLDVAAELLVLPCEQAAGRRAEHLRFLHELGVGSYACVPLVSRERTLGTLTVVGFVRSERLTHAEVEVASDLAQRIALAIDNAGLHAMAEQRRAELELANRSKDVFLATLSQKLRTPLNAIVGWTDMVKKGALSASDLSRAMETIDRSAQAMSGLLGDLLDVSRIVTGTLRLESKQVSLPSIVESAVAAARPHLASKQIALEISMEEVNGIVGDPERLRQVVANLLSNAVKFTPAGGKVSVRVEGDAERVRATVSDTGEGIAPDVLPHVFERFREEYTERTRIAEPSESPSTQAGLGLGLAIVKHVVEEHGGTVRARSEGRGKGATFSVELPVLGGPAPAMDVEALPPATGEPDLAGVNVLIVEDDPDGNELVCTILERYGARVTSATTAQAAIDAMDKERPQVLISDIGLPDMDGIDLIKQVRARKDDGSIPAIALTAYASRRDATKVIAAGFDAHVAKPVQPGTLGSVVVRLLARGGAALGEPSSVRGAASYSVA